jgi:hypothetical protein
MWLSPDTMNIRCWYVSRLIMPASLPSCGGMWAVAMLGPPETGPEQSLLD